MIMFQKLLSCVRRDEIRHFCKRANRVSGINMKFSVASRPLLQSMQHVLDSPSSREPFKYSPAIDHIAMFQKLIGVHNVISDSFDMDKYRFDWKRNYFGGSLVITPTSSEQIQEVMRYCHANKIGVVVQGGNTGLVGGAVGTDRGELIISMEKLNKVLHIDPDSATVICEAGCILEILNAAVGEHGFMIPLDLGPKGSCQIGGNISTNAGGLRVVRYGSLQTNVLGLEVIQANGDKLDLLRTLYKDNTGYHLRHLFIGAEGTLGVVTKIALRLATIPESSAVIFAKIPNFQAISAVLKQARRILGANLSAFEFMDTRAINAIRQAAPHLLHRVSESVLPQYETTRNRLVCHNDSSSDKLGKNHEISANDIEFGIPGEVSLLIEATGTDPETDAMKLDKFLTQVLSPDTVNANASPLMLDAVMAQDQSQTSGLWLVREQCAVALMDVSRRITPFDDDNIVGEDRKTINGDKVWCGYLFKYDISLSLTAMPEAIKETMLSLQQLGFHVLPAAAYSSENTSSHANNNKYATQLEFCNYGHVGDQNVHLNILMHTPCVRQKPNDKSPFYTVIDPLGISKSLDSDEIKFADYAHEVHHVIDAILYKHVLQRRGSVSAEHGIGQEKKQALLLARSGPEWELMKAIKRSLDPDCILNPGKMF